MDAKCFARMELAAEFDAHRRELSRHVSGGEFVEPQALLTNPDPMATPPKAQP
jgi:hypothetical protein